MKSSFGCYSGPTGTSTHNDAATDALLDRYSLENGTVCVVVR